jgi:hypothetical protein
LARPALFIYLLVFVLAHWPFVSINGRMEIDRMAGALGHCAHKGVEGQSA